MTRLRAQLLSHLGTCALENGDTARAAERFAASGEIARQDANMPALAFAALVIYALTSDGTLDRSRERDDQADDGQ